MPDGVISTMEVRGVLFAVQIRKGSVDVEPVHMDSKLSRSSSCPALGAGPLEVEAHPDPVPVPETAAAAQLADSLALHRSGKCLPCIFSSRMADGCRLGDQCPRCHICTLKEMKSQRRRWRRAAKRNAKNQEKDAAYQATRCDLSQRE
mmetsp:Transcript_39877/g.95148  ORF Transcript_39877/g.95148 Transcript_39877/m.95148 type:complete len:148 (+) Transcript_39877:47-490(+)